jgi:hypothetical protein
MPLNTYIIELKLDAPDENHEAMNQIVKQYARDMLSSAMLLSPGKQPQVIARSEDCFYDQTEIEVLDPSDNVHEPS